MHLIAASRILRTFHASVVHVLRRSRIIREMISWHGRKWLKVLKASWRQVSSYLLFTSCILDWVLRWALSWNPPVTHVVRWTIWAQISSQCSWLSMWTCVWKASIFPPVDGGTVMDLILCLPEKDWLLLYMHWGYRNKKTDMLLKQRKLTWYGPRILRHTSKQSFLQTLIKLNFCS